MDLLIVAQDEVELRKHWAEASRLWLESFGSDATRRAYNLAWRDLLGYLGEIAPWRIGRAHIASWVGDMRERGLSDCTRNLHIAGISSFYRFAMTEYTVIDPTGREVPLHGYNPAAGRSLRAKINPYGKASALTLEEVRRLLGAIDRSTVQGARDYALFLTYLFTGRRASELRNLRWGDMREEGGRIWYRWSGKGRRDQRHEMALPAYLAIRAYLERAGRLEGIEPDAPVFIGVVSWSALDRPITTREIGRLVKRYAALAGLDQEAIHPHTLRHTAALLRRQAGDDVEAVSRLLAHSSLAITQIYLHGMEGAGDASWQKVGELLGVGE